MHPDFSVFTDLALLFSAAVLLALFLARFKLPPVLAYVGTGVLLGPPGLGLVARDEPLQILAEIGVIILLFTVGLEFSLSELRRSWRAILLAGSLQVLGTVGLGFAVATALGIAPASAITWGFLVSLGSTAVVLRGLDARGETKAAHGRLVVGVLIFQDLCVVPMMLLLPIFAGEGGGFASVIVTLLKAAAIVAIILLAARTVVPPLMASVAKTRNREVFLLAVLAMAGVTAYVTSMTGLSLALGAFLAGVVLADTQYSHQALADVLPLRAVMMCVFFVSIGMLVDIQAVQQHPWVVGLLFLGILVGKFGAMLVAGLALRFPVRVTALAAAALAQVGEFSFVLSSTASEHGLIDPTHEKLFLAASVLTIATAPVALSLFPKLLAGSRALAPLELRLDGRTAPEVVDDQFSPEDHVIVAGLGVGGRSVLSALELAKIEHVIIELNPETVTEERKLGRHVVYGDVTSQEVLEHAGIHKAKAMVLVVSDAAASRRAADVARTLRADLPIILRTRFAREEFEESFHGTDVCSEEFAGAMSVTRQVLHRCEVAESQPIIDMLMAKHLVALGTDVEPLPPQKEPTTLTSWLPQPTWLQRWTVAGISAVVAGTAFATAGSEAGFTPFVAFLAAVAVSAFYGGRWPGIATAVAGWAFSNIWFLDPIGELSFTLSGFALLGVYIITVAVAYRWRADERKSS